MELEGAW
jgi:hypothetical protein